MGDLNKATADALRTLAALDLADLNDQADRLRSEAAEALAAIDRASDRRREISNLLASSLELQGETVAEAILAGDAPSDAATRAPGRDSLIAERETLGAAISQLERREQELRREIVNVEAQAQQRVDAALAPLASAMREEAQAAALRLVAIYADVAALSGNLASFSRLQFPARQAVEGLAGANRLLDYRRTFPVSSGVIDLQHAIRKAAPAIKLGQVGVHSAMP